MTTKDHIMNTILALNKLQENISTTYELNAEDAEKPKLFSDIERITSIRNQIIDLEVNETRFGIGGPVS